MFNLKYLEEFFYGLAQLRALGVPFGCHFFASSQRNGERKDAQAFPLGPPLALPLCKAKDAI